MEPENPAKSTRDRIVEAAAGLLTEDGREAVSTRAVSAAARVQAPTIYRLFGDKQGLLDAVASHGFASYLRGKTLLRDAISDQLRCSAYEAEELVETLELMGYVRFPHLADATHPLTRHSWVISEPSL